jgi:hypothetical protein
MFLGQLKPDSLDRLDRLTCPLTLRERKATTRPRKSLRNRLRKTQWANAPSYAFINVDVNVKWKGHF